MPGNIVSTVEVAWNAGYTTAAASRTWTDITDKVEPGGVDIQRGRQNEMSEVSASTCGLTLDNRDGRFTPEYASGAYYPNVKKGRPIRVRTGLTDQTIAFDNFSTADSTIAVWDGPSGPGRVTPTGSYTWAGQTQDWGVSSQKAYMPGTGGTVTIDVGLSDVTVECDYTVGAALNLSGLACRYVDDSNRIRVVADSGGGGRWLIQKIVAGVTTNVGTGGVAAVSTTYAMKVVLSGSSVDLYVGGVLTVSGTIADAVLLAATKFGLGAGNATDHRWDAFTVKGVVYATQFLGYVDEWPVEWPGGSDAMATASIKATSRMARLSLGLPYRSIVEEEILDDDPVLYWPLGEPEGATEAGNIAAGRSERLVVTQRGTGGTLAFGTGIGPGTDDLSTPTFTAVDANNGLHLLSALISPVTQSGDHGLALSAWFSTTSAGDGIVAMLAVGDTLRDANSAVVNQLGLHLVGGTLQAAWNAGTSSSANVSAAGFNDGNVHHAVALLGISDAGTSNVTLIVDGVDKGTTAAAWPVNGGVAFFPSYTHVHVGGAKQVPSSPLGEDMFTGTIAHVAAWRSAAPFASPWTQFIEYNTAGTTGFAGEASGARIARYARMAGIPTAEISTETGLSTSIAHRDTTGQSAIQMMQDVAHTEDGVVFDGKDGTLTFHARDHRYGATTAFTLSCADGEVEPNLAPVLDDQGMLNDVTASREDGATARSVNQASIDEYGVYRDTVELMTTSDNEVQSRADWEVNRRATPRVKLTAVTVDVMVASDAQAALILAADIGTRFTVEDLPAQAPATSMDFFVEGITYDIADDRFVATFNTSAAILSTVWILDSATLSQLDSTTVLAY